MFLSFALTANQVSHLG